MWQGVVRSKMATVGSDFHCGSFFWTPFLDVIDNAHQKDITAHKTNGHFYITGSSSSGLEERGRTSESVRLAMPHWPRHSEGQLMIPGEDKIPQQRRPLKKTEAIKRRAVARMRDADLIKKDETAAISLTSLCIDGGGGVKGGGPWIR